jgi:hypothetical protein
MLTLAGFLFDFWLTNKLFYTWQVLEPSKRNAFVAEGKCEKINLGLGGMRGELRAGNDLHHQR